MQSHPHTPQIQQTEYNTQKYNAIGQNKCINKVEKDMYNECQHAEDLTRPRPARRIGEIPCLEPLQEGLPVGGCRVGEADVYPAPGGARVGEDADHDFWEGERERERKVERERKESEVL
jgi:hypothetical protein